MRKIICCIVLSFLFLAACQKKVPYVTVTGLAQGTYYRVVYQDDVMRKAEFDSLLANFDTTFSIYIPESIISRVNANDSTVVLNEQFRYFFKQSQRISAMTDGLFDITVGPLVSAWKFGPDTTKWKFPSQREIDSILEFTGMNKISLKGDSYVKQDPRVQITGNANAQGYSSDLLAQYLESLGIKNYLVDVGSEMKAKGVNAQGKPWRIGITRPEEGIDNLPLELQSEIVIELKDRSLATSGNYRKFFYKDGKKYAHTVNPHTGQSIPSDVLSATIIADECIDADAVATACMAMGVEKSKLFLQEHPEFDAVLIYAKNDELAVYKTNGVKVSD